MKWCVAPNILARTLCVIDFIGLLAAFKPDGECPDRTGRMLAHDSEQSARIDARTQEKPQRDIASELKPHSILQQDSILFDQPLLVIGLPETRYPIPEPLHLDALCETGSSV